MDDRSTGRAVWALMQRHNALTLDYLGMITESPIGDVAVYLNLLIRNGHAEMSGVRNLRSGEAQPLFRLVNATGPEAPYVDDDGNFVDPNRPHTPKRRPKREFPSLTAVMRLEAEWFRGSFTQADLAQRCGVTRAEMDSSWGGLRRTGELEPTGESSATGQMLYLMKPNEKVNTIRDFLRANLGRDVRGSEIQKLVPGLKHGSVIARALDLLAAEGFEVSINSRFGKMVLNLYRVEKKAEPQRHEATKKKIHRRGAEDAERTE